MGTRDCIAEACSGYGNLERLRYFPRQLLTADDMRAEQEYFREKQRRHNRLLHGCGVVCGLEVVIDTDKDAPPLGVRICGGYALGPFGDEIFVPEPVPLDLAYCAQPPAVPCDPKYPVVQPALTTPILVMIRYAECPTRPMRTLPAGCGCDETACEYSRLRDGFEVQCMLKPRPTKEKKMLADAPTLCEIERDRKDKPPQDKLPKCPEPTDPWVLLAEVTLVTETGKDPSLAPEKIDNGVRSLVYSTTAIQQQVILSCCK